MAEGETLKLKTTKEIDKGFRKKCKKIIKNTFRGPVLTRGAMTPTRVSNELFNKARPFRKAIIAFDFSESIADYPKMINAMVQAFDQVLSDYEKKYEDTRHLIIIFPAVLEDDSVIDFAIVRSFESKDKIKRSYVPDGPEKPILKVMDKLEEINALEHTVNVIYLSTPVPTPRKTINRIREMVRNEVKIYIIVNVEAHLDAETRNFLAALPGGLVEVAYGLEDAVRKMASKLQRLRTYEQ